jgi:predicted nucleotidyltransferase
MMSQSEISQILPGILVDFPGISLVYLFGSQVEGGTGPMSDFDLAIFEDSLEDDNIIQAQFQHALALALHTNRLDVVLLRRVPIELAYHVIAGGKLIYKRDIFTQVEFEAQVLGLYGDYLPVLRSQRDQILEGDENAKRIQRYREALERTRRALGAARTP